MHRRSLVVLISIALVALLAAAYLIATETEPAPSSTTSPAVSETTASTQDAGGSATTPTTSSPETTAAPTTTSSTTPSVTVAPGGTACDPYGDITVAGTVASTDLVEASGMAASRTRPGAFWTHNDSRDGARAYAIGSDGTDLGGFDIAGAFAFDWEDMAAGPGGDAATSTLFFGDIGDNFAIRGGQITVYRVAEPDPASLDGPIGGAEALEFEYPDGVFNAEALFLADTSIYIVTKDRDQARVYRGDATRDAAGIETLEYVTSLDLGAEVSGADVSWDGSTIALRGYNTVWLWHRAPGASIAEALSADPCSAPSPDEIQGESIAFTEDNSYATVSEGRNPDLFVVPFGS